MRSMLQRTLVLAALVTFFASPAAAAAITNLFVFGDSLVDAGNVQVVAPSATPASAGYFNPDVASHRPQALLDPVFMHQHRGHERFVGFLRPPRFPGEESD